MKHKGYLKKWIDAKYVLGCAVFMDLLYLCSIFSKAMQSDGLDIVGALTCLISIVKETNKPKTKSSSQWLTYSATMGKITSTNGEHFQALKQFTEAGEYFERLHKEYCTKILECIQNC